MNDPDDQRLEEEKERREGELVRARLVELYETPIRGNFDAEHLRAVHAYLFQDLPDHSPGITRDDEPSWVKRRALEGQRAVYTVPYAHEEIHEKITTILADFGGASTLKDLSPNEAAERIATLYGDLDHAHGFYEGNSRTLREFTRELAAEAGFNLDWTRTGVGTKERNELYIARDIAVLERAYPDLTPERALKTNDKAEYEASFVLEGLRRAAGENSLSAIIRDRLTPARSIEREQSVANEQSRSAGATDAVRSTAAASLRVVDMATGAVDLLSNFVDALLGSKPTLPPEGVQRVTAQRRALAAMESMRESMERGENLHASDVAALTPSQLENIKAKGDDHVREMIADAARWREKYLGKELER